MTATITLPRSVVEQALEALDESYADTRQGRALADALRAALEQPQDHCKQNLDRVPTGWKLVPVEPTKDMKAAGAFAAMDQVRSSYNPPSAYIPVDSMALLSYRAMLAAAPQPPTVKEALTTQPQVEQEPVAWYDGKKFYGDQAAASMNMANMSALAPVYLHPQPKREPLIGEAERQCPYPKANPSTRNAWLDGWEAAERAHGIGGEA